jgi:hypothetical protein
MRYKSLLTIFSAILVLFSTVLARADYSNTVMSLHPVAYWPLNETVQPASAYIATNSGSLGPAGNGYYETWFNPDTNDNGFTAQMDWSGPIAGATSDGDGAANFGDDDNRYIVIPHTYSGTVIKAPFTIECWADITNSSTWVNAVGDGGQGGESFDANGDWAGFNLNIYNGNWLFDLYNTNGNHNSLELSSAVTAGQWTYLVATFDGTNAALYVDGSEAASGIPNTNGAGQYYVPDAVNPILLGTFNRPQGGGSFPGYLDEVAIYTNVLASTDIANHYNAATAGGYAAVVRADHPIIYLRLDEPLYQLPAQSSFASFPKAENYGSLGGAADGLYQPGTLPGVPGPSGAGFGTGNYAVAINGVDAAVDVGNGSLTNVAPALNAAGTNELSVVAWFQGNPADGYNRFQSIVGHGDSGWRFGIGEYGPQFNPGGSEDLSYLGGDVYNDGRWHMAVGVYTGSTNELFVDGTLVATAANNNLNTGSGLDIILGGAPDYTKPYGRYWDGSLAQVAYFTNALSAANVEQLYSVAGIAPYVLQSPVAGTVNAGVPYTNTVVIDGSAPLSYQWYFNGSPVSGQTNSSLYYNSLLLLNAGNYFVIATNNEGAVTSSVVALKVNTSLQITTEPSPTNFVLFAGGSATLSVQASGAQPMYFYWKSGGTVASTNATFNLTNAGASSDYVCLVSNYLGTVASTPVSVIVEAQPANFYPQAVLADNPMAYWRLDEPDQGYPNDGVVAHDYWGGHNGVYTNTSLGQPGYFANPPDPDTAALFGATASFDSDMQAPGIDFAVPSGGNAEFSLEAWVYTTFPQYIESDGSGIITKGTGDGGEEFNLDTGSGGGDFRFFVRDASGGVHLCNSTIAADSNWHHLVGVCDEANGNLFLYVDGVLAASSTIEAGSGLESTANETVSIGARQSGTGEYDDQFPGVIDEVAIYDHPLSASQVLSQYYAIGGYAPSITQQPTNMVVNVGESASFSAMISGSPALACQWYDVTAGSPGIAIPGATSSTLTLEDVTASQNGTLYQLLVTNLSGHATTTVATLTVEAGAPTLLANLQPLTARAFVGLPITFSVAVGGTPPFGFQWLQDGSRVGPVTNIFTVEVLPGTNTYLCVITNYSGSVTSSTSTIVGITLTDTGSNSANSATTFAVNFMDAANAAYTPDQETNWFNAVYEGFGAYTDDADGTNWNGFGIFPNGYEPAFNATAVPQVGSDGTLTPITLSLVYGADIEGNNGLYYGPGLTGNTGPGQPSFILGNSAIVNGNYPGIGTSSKPLGGITLSNVPPGVYNLYLYGTGPDNDRGATFAFASGAALGGSNVTINADDGNIPATNFVYGATYIIFTNVVPNGSGVISGTWGAVSNPISGNTGEGDFNGLQLIRVAGPAVSNQPVLTIRMIEGNAIVNWSPNTGVLQSATSLDGPFTSITGSTPPYTNTLSGTQQFFRVSVP